jgi:hypothetical protein
MKQVAPISSYSTGFSHESETQSSDSGGSNWWNEVGDRDESSLHSFVQLDRGISRKTRRMSKFPRGERCYDKVDRHAFGHQRRKRLDRRFQKSADFQELLVVSRRKK